MSMTMWGIHNDSLAAELVEQGFISVGWEAMPDLRTIGDDQGAIKDALTKAYPTAKPGAIPVWAGVLRKFAFELASGDVVIAPYKQDRTLNFGVVSGPYRYEGNAEQHPHRRSVNWIKTGVPRGLFPQSALYEIGSAVTLFQVKKHAGVFQRFLDEGEITDHTQIHVSLPADTHLSTSAEDEPNADRIHQHTTDFIASILLNELTHEEFEHFTADLLRALGYEARVTPYASDGGVDVIAHKDPLGLEPPIIKVQCKHTAKTQSRPDVQRLIGTLAATEVGLFVTLGTYSKDAVDLERERQNLRLYGGAEVTALTLAHYERLPSRWRSRMPLRSVLVVDREPEIH